MPELCLQLPFASPLTCMSAIFVRSATLEKKREFLRLYPVRAYKDDLTGLGGHRCERNKKAFWSLKATNVDIASRFLKVFLL